MSDGYIYTSDKYPEAPYGMEVSEGGPSANTLSAELEHMTNQLRNISDEDLYRVYHERWVNPDRKKTGWNPLKGDHVPMESARMRRLQSWIRAGTRFKTQSAQESIQEYTRDRDALERERLLHYMIDPETELLEDEAILGALFPDVENTKYPAFEMYKYKIKIEELHPYTYAIWDNVRHFYAREDQIDTMLKMQEPYVGTLPYADPIGAYESLYDPVNQLVRTVAARTGDFMHHGNPADEIENSYANLYDYEGLVESVEEEEEFEKELQPPPPEMFVMYAKAMLAKAKNEHRFNPVHKSDNKQDVMNVKRLDTGDLDYWNEIVTPFEYEAKEAPIDRPLFIEVPHIETIRLGNGTWQPDANQTHNLWANWKFGVDNQHLYGEKGERTLQHAALGRHRYQGPGANFMLPKYSSKIVFDYISYAPSNPNTIIDSTYRIGEPIKIHYGLDELPKCLAMTVPRFPQGSRFKVTCPPRLLFGYDGWPQRGYPANSEIEFDIEIREVGVPNPLKSVVAFYHDSDNKNSLY